MKRWLKYAGIALAVIVLVLAGAIGALYWKGRSALSTEYTIAPTDFEIPHDAAALEEGQRLFRARGCAACHGDDGGGAVIIDAEPIGRLVGANITVIAPHWRPRDFDTAIRHGVSPAGRPYLFMPAHDYWPMSDRELGLIAAYAQSLPRSSRALAPSDVHAGGYLLGAIGAFPLVPAEQIDHDTTRPELHPGTREFGSYLGRTCAGCHGDHFSGGPIPGAPEEEVGVPTNLTPDATGLREWSEADFVALMRTGRTREGRVVNERHMPWNVYRYMSDSELHDLWDYLRSLPPLAEGNR
jgi:mono/diheme cytochrome c family protein